MNPHNISTFLLMHRGEKHQSSLWRQTTKERVEFRGAGVGVLCLFCALSHVEARTRIRKLSWAVVPLGLSAKKHFRCLPAPEELLGGRAEALLTRAREISGLPKVKQHLR